MCESPCIPTDADSETQTTKLLPWREQIVVVKCKSSEAGLVV